MGVMMSPPRKRWRAGFPSGPHQGPGASRPGGALMDELALGGKAEWEGVSSHEPQHKELVETMGREEWEGDQGATQPQDKGVS